MRYSRMEKVVCQELVYIKNKLDKITDYSILEKAVKSPSPERVFRMVNHD
jgi:predicted HAD superfamily hydrolase